MNLIKNKLLRLFLFSFGLICLALGIIGLFLPILPTTPFILLAAWCLLRSSPKAHGWIYNHSLLGPPLKEWSEKGVISRRPKVIASLTISLSLVIIWTQSINFVFRVLLTTLLVAVLTFIISRPSK